VDRAIGVELTAYGERGLLIQVRDTVEGTESVEGLVLGWAQAVRDARLTAVLDVVPAAQSVLLHLAEGVRPQQLRDTIAALQPSPEAVEPDGSVVEILVTYDGPDLDDVARLTGLTTAEVVAAHTGTLWRVAFAGFVPGFAYLTSPDGRLSVPRRADPRTRVPPGAVAVAGGYSAVYPRASPGGWRLIGQTDRPMWDLEADPPATLTPGRSVRFVDRSR
jgi:KipI family sensor histidine kinase inhibitor